jgi:hypothetical protein
MPFRCCVIGPVSTSILTVLEFGVVGLQTLDYDMISDLPLQVISFT